jgi:hypothetical protein
MGQDDILEFLKKNPKKKFDTKSIAKALKIGVPSATYSLKALRNNSKFFHTFRFKPAKNGFYNLFLYWYDPKARGQCKERTYL